MRITIVKKIVVLLLLMLFVAMVNVAVIYYFQNQQKHDSHVVNVAGRQRMLSQRISKFALLVAAGNNKARKELKQSMNYYETSLDALWRGGIAMGEYIPPAPESMNNIFQNNKDLWAVFKKNTEIVVKEKQNTPKFLRSVNNISKYNEDLLSVSDLITLRFDRLFSRKVIFLKSLLVGLLVLDIVFFFIGCFLGTNIVRPIKVLSSAVRRIGAGDLSAKISVSSDDEIGDLSESFNKMIRDLKYFMQKEKELATATALADIEKRKSQELAKAYRDLKEMQDRLIRSEKLAAIGEMAGLVSHELKNPLGVIKNVVYYLKMKLGEALEDPDIREKLNILDSQVNISDRIITDILIFGRIKEPKLESTNIVDTIKEVIEGGNIPSNIEVIINTDDSMLEIMADEDQLKHVFGNIISNAVDAMPDGGKLTATIVRKEGTVDIAIGDTGIGIPYDNIKKIFKPLFSTKEQGTGLGLSGCQSIIDGHRGTINVKSELGRGSKFIIKLPIM